MEEFSKLAKTYPPNESAWTVGKGVKFLSVKKSHKQHRTTT